MRTRLFISTAIGLASGVFCWDLMVHVHQGSGDFTWAIQAARDLLAGKNPYATRWQLYPLPAAIFGLPFIKMQPEVAAGLFYGISSALLAFGVMQRGIWHLLIFLAYPYWAGMLSVQWIPLIMSSAFFSWLLPVTLAKPQIGLPVALTHVGRKGTLGCLILVLLSFAIMPRWFPLWLGQLGGYEHFVPLLVFPGPLLVLALLRYRNRDAWFFFLAASMPQRWYYDPFFLWLIPKTRREIVYTAGLSWIPGIWRWHHGPHSFTEVGRWTVVCLYLPMLAVLLLQKTPADPQDSTAQEQTNSGENIAESESYRGGSETSLPKQL